MPRFQVAFALLILATTSGCVTYAITCESISEYYAGGEDKAMFMSDAQTYCSYFTDQPGVRVAIMQAKEECEAEFDDPSVNVCRLYDINGIRTMIGHARFKGYSKDIFVDPTPADIAYRDGLDSLPKEAGKLMSVGDPPLPNECLDYKLFSALHTYSYDGLQFDARNGCGVLMRVYICIPYKNEKAPEKMEFYIKGYLLQPHNMYRHALDLSKTNIDKSDFDYRIAFCPERRKCGWSCPP